MRWTFDRLFLHIISKIWFRDAHKKNTTVNIISLNVSLSLLSRLVYIIDKINQTVESPYEEYVGYEEYTSEYEAHVTANSQE